MSDTPKGPEATENAPESNAEPQVFQAATAMFSVPKPAPASAHQQADEATPTAEEVPGRVWHVVLGSAQEGPISPEEMAAKLHAGTITPTALVWRSGMANWSPLQEVAEFASLPMNVASTVPPTAHGAPQIHGDHAAMGPAADAALSALMRADLQDMDADPAPAPVAQPQSPHVATAPTAHNLSGQDLFGSNETQFLQVPGSVAAVAPEPHSPAPAPAAAAAAPKAKGLSRNMVWAAAGAAALAAAIAGALLLARPVAAPSPLPAPVEATPPSSVAAPAAPAAAAPAAVGAAPLPGAPASAAPPQSAQPAGPVNAAPRPAAAGDATGAPKLEAPAADERAPSRRGRSSRHGRRSGHGHKQHRHQSN